MDPRIGMLMREGTTVYYAYVGKAREYVEALCPGTVTLALRDADRPRRMDAWQAHNLRRAWALDEKARTRLERHRGAIRAHWDDDHVGAFHQRAIRRINRLMDPSWQATANHRAGERLLRRTA